MEGSELRARPRLLPPNLLRALLIFLGTVLSRPALAEEPRVSRAEELFREGKALLGARDYARACPLLATSFDLEPGTGVLLALAICHEGEGRLASASAEYKLAAERSATEGRADRARVARDRMLALEPRLSTLAIVPPAEARSRDHFVIRRSGVVLEREVWDTPVALDGGEYVVEASDSGKRTWRSNVALAASGERRTVTIPSLDDIAPAKASLAAAPPPANPHESTTAGERDAGKSTEGGSGLTPLQVVGIGTMAAGAIGIGVGTIYAIRALKKYEDSNDNGCEGDVCEGQGKADRQAARSAGNTATVAFAVGATLAVGGTVLFVLGAPSKEPAASSGAELHGAVSVTSGGVMFSFGGSL